MPLAFESDSHGTIVFGFFNIESDMLMLDRYFFFAADFCATICDMAKPSNNSKSEFALPGYIIEDPEHIGDLHGAIEGTHFSGFIGESYKKYPFPQDPLNFKQQTTGFNTRTDFEKMILNFGPARDLILIRNFKTNQITVDPYQFSQQHFSQLINYVIQGGYPRWLNDAAPDYVTKMQSIIPPHEQ